MANTARYLIGIDLGTTNSALAYIDSQAESPSPIQSFAVPQIVRPGEVQRVPVLPSFLYFPTESDLAMGSVSLPWNHNPDSLVGVLAREQGPLAPGRQVSSAKSWLCQSAVDRTAQILPREADAFAPRVSPVEASARYLAHLREAWDAIMASNGRDESARFENQDIVLTVPASFDEEARELTVQAAQEAGLRNLTLLEEPLAVFYSWLTTNRDRLHAFLKDDDLVLICDIGGGTTDFSLIRVHVDGDEVRFERTAIGEHLLLGGDNLDLALVRRVEKKFGSVKLSLRQQLALRRVCCVAKEHLLSDDTVEAYPVSILGTGHAVVGQMLSTDLSRNDVLGLLIDGFLPLTQRDEFPVRERRSGLRELGLPYVSDPAITRHLAGFLAQAARTMQQTSEDGHRDTMMRPDAILFNGGFCIPPIVRGRIQEAVSAWFRSSHPDWNPRSLNQEVMENTVAVGAAYYGRVRRGTGLRIRAASPRTYYIALRTDQQAQAVCVLPAGVDEGTTLTLSEREFAVVANRPASFSLYSSRVRHDSHGEVITLSENDFHRHAPLVTLLRYGKKLRQLEIGIRLTVTFTELGTLELWCESLNTDHRWRLQFELRGEQQQPGLGQNRVRVDRPGSAPPAVSISEQPVEEAQRLIRSVFGANENRAEQQVTAETLVSGLERAINAGRESWTLTTIRMLCDALIEVAAGRNVSPRHEVRWLNLLGFCLRPGFGAPEDDARLRLLRKLTSRGPVFPNDLQSQVEWLILWRRISGGVNASHQHELHRNHTATLLQSRRKKGPRLNRQVERETWRLLAALEQLPARIRTTLGNEILTKIAKDPDGIYLWALGRFGSRIPLYGPLSSVVPASVAEEWLQALLGLAEITSEAAFAIVQLGWRTDDTVRDIDENLRRDAVQKLQNLGFGELVLHLQKYTPPARSELARIAGESLPRGLNLFSSPNCLLPVTGLISETDKSA